MKKVLVIDTNVIKSAGQSTVGESSNSRRLLEDVLRICHKLCWSPEYKREWLKHASRYSRAWLRKMDGKKKVIRFSAEHVGLLRERILNCDIKFEGNHCQELAKDAFLIEMARLADGVVITYEKNCIQLFEKYRKVLSEYGDTYFYTPNKDPDVNRGWLESGDLATKCKRLVFKD